MAEKEADAIGQNYETVLGFSCAGSLELHLGYYLVSKSWLGERAESKKAGLAALETGTLEEFEAMTILTVVEAMKDTT